MHRDFCPRPCLYFARLFMTYYPWRPVTVSRCVRGCFALIFAFFSQDFVDFRANARKLTKISEKKLIAHTFKSGHEPPLPITRPS